MMDYRLRVFRKVAELQSVSQAAKALRLSQPAVSKHIQLLEAELRVPLFTRVSNGMILTPPGVIYLQHAQQIQQAHDEVMQHLQAPGISTGRLRLGSNKTLLAYYLPEILNRFKQRYPSVVCDVIDGNTDTIIGALLDQHIDLALIEGPCQRPELEKHMFLEDEIIWIASPGDPILNIKHPTIKQVLERPLIIREVGSGSRQFMEQALRQLRFPLDKLNIAQEIPSPEAIKRMVSLGLGIGYVFRSGVEPELAAGKLVRINCPKLNIRRPFSVLHPRGPVLGRLNQDFIQLLMEGKR
ncbi:MAG TPA: LysR family transcriptional regulator [Verrucomicrobiae bacterium]|jgi:DNA-binding transcriptional LysR family regulator